jgi:hypothetical protein
VVSTDVSGQAPCVTLLPENERVCMYSANSAVNGKG